MGFYGLDVYSLWESLDEIVGFLEKINSPELETAKKAFACFEPHNRNNESYAVSAGYLSEDCMNEAFELLSTIQKNKWKFKDDQESSLNMEVNALVTAHAEEYYRTMVKSDDESWNIRDRHMVDALQSIVKFYGNDAKVIIWEHNTHVGDARYTDMKDGGMVNVGQLVRETYGENNVFIIGSGSYSGSVIASDQWGGPITTMSVPPAQNGSWEELLHRTGAGNKIVLSSELKQNNALMQSIGQRAIGVVYDPNNENGNYVPSVIPNRYDAFVFTDRTSALHPINVSTRNEPPDTYPSGY